MKKLLLGSTRLIRDFGRDADGSTALTFGLGLTVMLVAMGAGIDFAMASKKQSEAQILADTVGLAAAVYIKNSTLKVAPTTDAEGYMHDKEYDVSTLGHDGFKTKAGDAKLVVSYGAEEAKVTVTGVSPTTFMAFAGVSETPYTAQTTVKYEQTGITPASIMLILDNSGSMGDYDKQSILTDPATLTYELPQNGQERIDGLKSATTAMVAKIKTLGSDAVLNKHVRMGMLPYDSGIITATQVNMDWGILSDSEIAAMDSGGGTNSAPPMGAAVTALKGEVTAHATKHSDKPLKFAVFMTDGVNNKKGPDTWVDKDDTTLWKTEACYYETCFDKYEVSNTTPTNVPWFAKYDFWTSYKPWTEGTLRGGNDKKTLEDCEKLKKDGVQVFAVGFGTGAGVYHEYDRGLSGPAWPISERESARITSFLKDCSSGTGYYMTADNASSLDKVFSQIGTTIMKQAVYISK